MPDQDASDGARDRLAPEMLLYGLVRAVGRFTRSGLNEEAITEPDDAPDLDRQVLAAEWGTAVFEALNWSVTLDERLRHELDGSDWTADLEGGGVVRALRYARNCVHHNWAAALDADLGPNELVAPHATVFGITWANELRSDRPDRRGTAAYGQEGERLLLIGHTDGGRALTLVIERTVDPTSWLIVTGWIATDRERRIIS